VGRNEGAHVPANQPNTRDPKTAPAMYTVPMMPTCCEEMPKAAAFVIDQTQPVTRSKYMSATTNAAGVSRHSSTPVRTLLLQSIADNAHGCDLEPVQHPRNAQGQTHQPVPSTPRQPDPSHPPPRPPSTGSQYAAPLLLSAMRAAGSCRNAAAVPIHARRDVCAYVEAGSGYKPWQGLGVLKCPKTRLSARTS
jgi:hypothetical protein